MADDRRGRSGTRYCSHCGRSLEPSMNYCPNCGTAIDRRERASEADRERSADDSRRRRRTRSDRRAGAGPDSDSNSDSDPDPVARKQLEARIARASRDGWRLEHDFGDHAVMVRRTFGDLDEHLLVALVTVWWTMGLGNALYGAYRYVEDAERMVLHAGPAEEPEREESSSHLLERATAAVCWVAAAILAAIGFQLSVAPGLGLFLLALAVGFAAAGAGALPSVRNRLARRRSVTTNGRARTVEERSVVAYDRPCSVCAEPVGRGLERVYRSDVYLLGVPLTGTAGRNYYCRECANAELRSAGGGRLDEDATAVSSPGDDATDASSESANGGAPERTPGTETEPEQLD